MSSFSVITTLGMLSAVTLAAGASLSNTVPESTQSYNTPFVVAEFRDSKHQEYSDEFRRDYFYLAATMWGEARGEGRTGMGFVGHVIMNRAAADFRGSNPTEVALYHKQFSCWNQNDPNREKLTVEYLENTTGEERVAWDNAKSLAYYILNGSADYTGGALHYHAKTVNPNWSSDYTVTRVEGSHIFYR